MLINWFRFAIVCLALIGFIIGVVLREYEFPDILTIMLATEAVIVFLYAEFAYRSKAVDQFRGWRIFLRLIMGFLTVYGPAKALSDCDYNVSRDYQADSPGFQTVGWIGCLRDGYDFRYYRSENALFTFRLFRARCIIMLTVFAMIFLEMICYIRSDEGTGIKRDAAMAEARNDVELANTSAGDSQKMMVPDPPHAQ
ncbi:hypothetical protein BGZ72_002841 [Mortierella alpina]|nr:hypothetical protein BGZ72_002841 [Mortierella alpina]